MGVLNFDQSMALYIARMSARMLVLADKKYDIVEFMRLCLTDTIVSKQFFSGKIDRAWYWYESALEEIEMYLSGRIPSKKCIYDEDSVYWAGFLYGYWSRILNDSPEDILKYAPTDKMIARAPYYHTLDILCAIEEIKDDYLIESKKED